MKKIFIRFISSLSFTLICMTMAPSSILAVEQNFDAWRGDWKNITLVYDNPSLDNYFIKVASKSKFYTPKGAKDILKRKYRGPSYLYFSGGKDIEFINHKGEIITEEYVGEGERPYFINNAKTWPAFKATGKVKSDKFRAKYIVIKAPGKDGDDGVEHFHMKISKVSYEDLIKGDRANLFPTYVRKGLPDEDAFKFLEDEGDEYIKDFETLAPFSNRAEGKYLSLKYFLNSKKHQAIVNEAVKTISLKHKVDEKKVLEDLKAKGIETDDKVIIDKKGNLTMGKETGVMKFDGFLKGEKWERYDFNGKSIEFRYMQPPKHIHFNIDGKFLTYSPENATKESLGMLIVHMGDHIYKEHGDHHHH